MPATTNHLVSPNATTTYTVTVTDFCNQTATNNVIVSIDAATVDAGADQNICEGESITLNAISN